LPAEHDIDGGATNQTGDTVAKLTSGFANASPTGTTLDPANVSNLWIVDSATDRVYQFDAAASRTSGSQHPIASFALSSNNTNPQAIADPPVSTQARSTSEWSIDAPLPWSAAPPTATQTDSSFDSALLAVVNDLDVLLGGSKGRM
jgi:hypothetical protein